MSCFVELDLDMLRSIRPRLIGEDFRMEEILDVWPPLGEASEEGSTSAVESVELWAGQEGSGDTSDGEGAD